MFRTVMLTSLILVSAAIASGQDMPPDYKAAMDSLGRQGDFKDNVLKVNIPRGDLKVTVAGVPTPTPFGFGGWIAMTKGDGAMQVLMGDLVLTQDEVKVSTRPEAASRTDRSTRSLSGGRTSI